MVIGDAGVVLVQRHWLQRYSRRCRRRAAVLAARCVGDLRFFEIDEDPILIEMAVSGETAVFARRIGCLRSGDLGGCPFERSRLLRRM